MYTRFPSLIVKTGSAGGGSYDSDAQAFFTAAGITSTTEKDAWNTFVNSAKSGDAYWNNLITIWPFLGSDANKTRYNAKNTATNLIVWNGSLTHDSMGVTGNGSTGYGTTGFSPSSSSWTSSSLSHGGYYRNAIQSSKIGITDVGLTLYTFNSGGQFYSLIPSSNVISVATTFSKFIISNVNTTNEQRVFRDGTDISSNVSSINLASTNELRLFGTTSYYSNHNLGMYYISTGLSTAQITQFTTNINTLMTSLGRNV